MRLFTDGCCLAAGVGVGGWACVLRHGGRQLSLSGAEKRTTSQRMELMAAIVGLERLTGRRQVSVCTDSRYVIGIGSGTTRKPQKNLDLVGRLRAVVARHVVRWEWVKGHNGHPENELCDRLAGRTARGKCGPVEEWAMAPLV